MKKEIITVSEYSAFCAKKGNGAQLDGYVQLEPSVFEGLEKFVLENNKDGEDGALELMGISARKGIGKIITAKNYVGVVVMNDGTAIEILPKIYSSDGEASAEEAKMILLKMLRALRGSPYKSFQTAGLDVCKMDVFEIFVRMFIDETTGIVKRGIKSSYEVFEENSSCFKGKVKFSEQVKYNYAHRERIYIAHDEFTVDRPENRLLKSTLAYLYEKTKSAKNKKDIKTLIEAFADAALSKNYDADFSLCIPDRNTANYTTALQWARVFLKGKSFTSFSGSNVSLALLFPMEQLFESYIAMLVKRELAPKGYTVLSQDRKYHLFDTPERKFLIKPDIVVIKDGETFVMDTKWKVLSENKPNYGISQADMYQMYVYQKKYAAENVTLIYPKAERVTAEIEFRSNESDNGNVTVRAIFADLLNEDGMSIERILRGLAEKT